MKYINIILLMFLATLVHSCENVPDPQPSEKDEYKLPFLNEPTHFPGIAVLTCDMGKFRSTEINSEYVTRSSSTVNTEMSIKRNGYNAALNIEYDALDTPDKYVEFVVSVYGKIPDKGPIPEHLAQQVKGISFRAVSPENPIKLELMIFDSEKELLAKETFDINQDSMLTFNLDISKKGAKLLAFRIEGSDESMDLPLKQRLLIDDIYLLSDQIGLFVPPKDDDEFLEWLKECTYRYYDWNYREVNASQGIVLEAAGDNSKVSLSGLGYALATFIIAAKDGYCDFVTAETRVLSILNWLHVQNWSDGSHGWHGFPKHYFNKDGSYYSSDISTIDWAMCAAGIRIARQFFIDNDEIVSIASDLLERPQWDKALGADGRIAMGFEEKDGTMNSYRWGLAFSEETELVYLEALASGKVDPSILESITREKKDGFYPSWFGAGFTYNWLQLWTGPIEPYRTNSITAYESDAHTSSAKFGLNVMGLTACATIKDISENGFINWQRYISNQGSKSSGATVTEVIQISPAPYGAALALPFIPERAIEALRSFVSIGYYHPLLGLPDNIRLNNLPAGILPAPNWDTFDINTGPVALAIEQTEDNLIGTLYHKDPEIHHNLELLINSFNY